MTGFTYLFFQTRLGNPAAFSRLFFRFDPLLFLLLSIAGRAVMMIGLWSAIILTGTVLFGRWFCGFACPLGTLIDLTEAVGSRPNPPSLKAAKNGKYLLLLFLIAAAAAGLSLGQFFDPLAIVDRTLTLVAYPVASFFAALLTSVKAAAYTGHLAALGSLILILGLGFWAPRFWCRSVCPLGGLLAIVAKISVFKFAFRKNCRRCGRCRQICPTAAVDHEAQVIDSAECIACLRCWAECPHGQIGYRASGNTAGFDVKRRHAVIALVAGVAMVPLVRSGLYRRLNGRLIRPPGALPETDFMNACLRCGLCLKVCPTNGLQPCLLEADVAGLGTPRLVGRIGGCEKKCNGCGEGCPTGAIRRLSLEEKSFAKLGTAIIDRHRCIAWAQDKVCLICDEACQYNAIESRIDRTAASRLLRPFVNELLCMGCGICESRCPLEGQSAIRVYSRGEERRRFGSYITDEKVRRRANLETPEDLPSGFITE